MSPLQFTTTNQVGLEHGVKTCVHGRAGAGKTTLLATLADTFPTLVVSAEAGLLSLRGYKIPTVVITTFDEWDEAYHFVTTSPHGQEFQAIGVDSISDIAEKCLAAEKGKTKDPRKAYGEMNDKVLERIKKWRDLPGRHVYFSAKQGRVVDEVTNVAKYGPWMPGQQLDLQMPYLFDEVFSLEIGKAQDGREFRYLRTKTDLQYEAKDRSGVLDPFEEPHLGRVIQKILGATSPR